MSLLIKALEAAEKDKLSEKGKKQTGAYVIDDVLSLELSLEQTNVADELAKFEAEAASPAYDDDFDFVMPSNDLADQGLTLEEEAGLMSANNYIKPKSIQDAAPKDTTIDASNKQTHNVDAVLPSNFSSQSSVTQAVEIKQKAAAKAFLANQSAKAPASKSVLALLGVVGALLIWLGLQGYTYLQSASTPEVVVVKPVLPPPQVLVSDATPIAVPQTELAPDVAVNDNQGLNSQNSSDQAGTSQALVNPTPARPSVVTKNDIVKNERAIESAHEPKVEIGNNPLVVERDVPNKIQAKKLKDNSDVIVSNRVASQKPSSVRLVSKMPSSGVDPTLLAAYQAFTRGEDSLAQQQYRQVLQHDVRNVDALLGMAMIAQRQNRDADAMGWYQKVLEIEPRNSIAQTAIASQQNGADAVGTESRIKNMLAQQPDAANLHAALGNLYVEQNQWAAAQEAYFNASRYAPNNADYAFNTAISLDQLGKSSLALSQYQRALALLNKSGALSPDRATLEARIGALQ